MHKVTKVPNPQPARYLRLPYAQFALAFAAGGVAAIAASVAPRLIFPVLPGGTAYSTADLARLNLFFNTLTVLAVSVIFGLAFWAFARGMHLLGFHVRDKSAWLSAALAAGLNALLATASVVISFNYYQVSPNNQVLLDWLLFLLVCALFPFCWWLTRHLSAKR